MNEIVPAKLLRVLNGHGESLPPIWLMRQAGRYLPEYRAARQRAGSFWNLCMTPELATKVTLQPIERFRFDAAIIFSDILVVPFALGCDVRFEAGEGPQLMPVNDAGGLEKDVLVWQERLAPCYEALRQTRAKLEPSKALLGFAGAPWTLATYMAEGHGSPDQRKAKLWGYRDEDGFDALLETVSTCVAQHLIAQLKAGADAVQIFDSWASGLPDDKFRCWVIEPTKKIIQRVRREIPAARIIGFPRAATLAGYEAYANETGVDAVSLDTAVPLDWAARALGGKVVLQGNLDPIVLIAGGDALKRAVDRILRAMRGLPFVFNLGHGVLPETPIEHVSELVARVRSCG